MKSYKKTDASFSDEVKIYESTDRAHADVLNIPLKMLYENTMALMWLWNNRLATEELNGLLSAGDKKKLNALDSALKALTDGKLDAKGTAENAKKVNGHAVETDVPEGAKFTDTTYSAGSEETSGLTKLYSTTGTAQDGAMTQNAVTNALKGKTNTGALQVNTLADLAHRRSFAGSVHIGKVGNIASWYNIISARHIGGTDVEGASGDEAKYGMYLKSSFMNDGSLSWGKQYHTGSAAGAWTGERTILDSNNFENYVHSLQRKEIFSGNKFIREGSTQVSLSNLETSMLMFEADLTLVNNDNETVCDPMSVVFGADMLTTHPLCGYSFSGGLSGPPSTAVIPITLDSYNIGKGKTTVMTVTVPDYGFYVDAAGGVDAISSSEYSLYLRKIIAYY